MKEKIKIKYNGNILEFTYNVVGGGYVCYSYREFWYYMEDKALYIWSTKGKWKKISKKEYEVIE